MDAYCPIVLLILLLLPRMLDLNTKATRETMLAATMKTKQYGNPRLVLTPSALVILLNHLEMRQETIAILSAIVLCRDGRMKALVTNIGTRLDITPAFPLSAANTRLEENEWKN